MNWLKYKGEKTREISFPIGGIGTGSIGLGGNGRLLDWEIYNKPSKKSVNQYSNFAVKAEKNGELLDARVLQGDLQGTFMGGEGNVNGHGTGYGWGPSRCTMAGMPHFADVEFLAAFPFARLGFETPGFPGKIVMTAFNPMIPTNDFDSSLPGAFFEFEIENNTNDALEYTISGSICNTVAGGHILNRYAENNGLKYIHSTSEAENIPLLSNGNYTIATDADETSYTEYWFRGSWFDDLTMFWRDFTNTSRYINRKLDTDFPYGDHCSLAAHISLHPGEKKKIRFLISWYFPNISNYWNPPKNEAKKCDCGGDDCCPEQDAAPENLWKNYYATKFTSSLDVSQYSFDNWQRLYDDSYLFAETLFSSTLPKEVIDAVSANISILKSPTCLRLEDGSFYGFEGCNCDHGCCEGSCTHVWNYAYALPFLFPKLERSMRELNFEYNVRDDGFMTFRIPLPEGRRTFTHVPCCDGQFGEIIKFYRDFKISGDISWLKKNWEKIKSVIEFAWAPTNECLWDADHDGVIEGRQHHTLDLELFGPNAWLTGFYLAALKAGAIMAGIVGDSCGDEYMELYEKGKKWVSENLFNGEYFFHKVDLNDKDQLSKYVNLDGSSPVGNYWSEELSEMKYQIGDGCGVDQVIAQWHANICGLGEIFDKKQLLSALRSIYKYNFKKTMRDTFNPCRIFCLNDESGVIICDYPKGVRKPAIPVLYSTETMNGFEYQVAVHMIQEGMVAEGLEIVKAIRDRFDGTSRNPWNEFECGSNYARSMASYSLLTTLSGFEFDLYNNHIGFKPVEPENFSCFWSVGEAFGKIAYSGATVEFTVLYGHIAVGSFSTGKVIKSVSAGDSEVRMTYSKERHAASFEAPVDLSKGQKLIFNHT
ncbi:MAG: GH116 family glycosyl-hydrolase [Saccharofermentanales bacterium]